jgi:hypothetical protein
MLMPVVYVAGPFRAKPDVHNQWVQHCNIRKAEGVAHTVWEMGAAAVTPHLNSAHFQGSLPDSVWLDGDLAILAKCDAVVMVDGWTDSEGAKAEQQFALSRGIPVFYSVQELRQWLLFDWDRDYALGA